MRFLFINQYYAPDYAATAQFLADMCESLAAMGHDVHVLASRSVYDGRDLELPAYERRNGVHVHRIDIASGERARFRDRMKGYLSFYLNSFLAVHRVPRADVVVALTTPPLIGLLGAYLRVVRRSRLVLWTMDVYPEIAVRAGVLPRIGILTALWSLLASVCHRLANRVVVLGGDMADELRRKGVPQSKIDVVTCWANADEVFPVAEERNDFRRTHFPGDDFVLMYSGNMGSCHEFRTLAGALKSLRGKGGSFFRTALVGGGKGRHYLEEQLTSPEDRATFLPYQEREALCESLSAADAHLISLQPKYDGLLVPSKLYAIMAVARPVLFVGSRRNHIARVIEEAGCGIVVTPGDEAGLLAAVRRLAEDRNQARAMGDRGREYFQRHFDRDPVCHEFALLLEREASAPGLRGRRRLSHAARVFDPETGTRLDTEPLRGTY